MKNIAIPTTAKSEGERNLARTIIAINCIASTDVRLNNVQITPLLRYFLELLLFILINNYRGNHFLAVGNKSWSVGNMVDEILSIYFNHYKGHPYSNKNFILELNGIL